MYNIDSKEVRCMKIRAYDYGLIGEKVKQARKTKRYTQVQLAEIIDMSSKNFSQIERGTTGISLTTLMSFYNFCKWKITPFFNGLNFTPKYMLTFRNLV